MEKFSVLMSVYKNEQPQFLREALESIFDQTAPPDELVLIKDGPLTPGLDAVVDEYLASHENIKLIINEKNLGLGAALNKGLMECSHEIVARMDSDDISHCERFEKQLTKIGEGYDLVSSWIDFFEDDRNNILAVREFPASHDEQRTLAKKRCPVGHGSCMFRKSKIIEVGSYNMKYPFLEDYYLWVRLLNSGARFYCIQEVLYSLRGSFEQFGRRGGSSYLRNEIRLHREFKKIGFISHSEYLRNMAPRIAVRLMPVRLRRMAYSFIWSRDRKKMQALRQQAN